MQKTDPDPNIDYAVLARYTVIGIVDSLVYHKWYKILEAKFPGTSLSAVSKKVLTDQLVFEPPMICLFYTGMSIMEGQRDITAEAKAKFLPTFTVSAKFIYNKNE